MTDLTDQYIYCHFCHKRVSTPFSPERTDTPDGGLILRAIVICPECLDKGKAIIPDEVEDIRKMSKEALAVLADDIADMAEAICMTRDVKSLRNMATNLAGMIRIHVK